MASLALLRDRKFVVTGLLVLFSVGFIGLYQGGGAVSPAVQGFIVSVVFFLAIPLLYCRMILKEPLADLGWRRGRGAGGVAVASVSVAAALGIVVLLAQFFPFRVQYRLPALVETSFLWFVLYEVGLVAVMALLYEAFFRGLVQTLWLRSLGWRAVAVQTGLFFLLVALGGGLNWRMAPLLVFSPFAGLVAYRADSLWYSWGASWCFLFLTDIFFLVHP